VNCLQGTSFWQLTLTGKTDIKISGCATPDLVLSHYEAKYTLARKKVKPAVCAKHKWLIGCAEINALLSVPIHHKIISFPTQK